MSTGASESIESHYVEVALPVPLRKLFTYDVPAKLRGSLKPGSRVAVPFSRRKLAGFVVAGREELPEGVSRALPVAGLLESEPVFSPELLRFLGRAAKYYMHPLGEVLRAAAPALPSGAMRRLREDGFLEATENLPGQRVAHHRTWKLTATGKDASAARLGARQRRLMDQFAGRDSILLEELRGEVSDPRAVARSLAEKGFLEVQEVEAIRDPFFRIPVTRDEPHPPTAAQRLAIGALVEALEKRSGQAFLLHGVTGSGKTEVYLRAIDQVRNSGRGAILLVPEIALTPQLVGRFRARFGDDIAVLHSALTARQREDAWQALRKGRVQVAIGARSALFAPVADLGLIVVDEEHDPSFKQDEGFRYHARDMALLRARDAGAICVLGSATPSVETYHRANHGLLGLLSLPSRATGATMPDVQIVDLRRHRVGPTGHPLISGPLFAALGRCLDQGHQAIVFLNRRGFAPSLRCESCGLVAECPACSVALTEHRGQGALRCHYCDFQRAIAIPCTACQGTEYKRLGVGTEQLQKAVEESFPDACVARLDRDTASGDGVEQVLDRLRSGEIDVLVGTQMVTKGHDIAGVTLVGVALADQSLAFPDFRASERTFQLLAQVAGRAGRADSPGEVVLQTFQPDHPAVRLAAQHDYESFYAEEIGARQEVGYPPFARLVSVRVHAGAEDEARRASQALADTARSHQSVQDGAVQVLGPAPAPLVRLRGRYHYRLLLKSPERKLLRNVTAHLAARIEAGLAPAHATLDIDPL
ncbi:MAG: primosomal protein N' [Deltaproteobacteria bacterium]|nr:primosomal protein N' [Deltaproteobacteria bacterium]NND29635.1 primosomal protein N' [Myxococcales bacterium]MBT8466865.1 primosomal protein N' [Deltaproteobacteria bacterium]MBT8479955.1 primosomal protein N' [Deltaproteobacteria bacterium]NNK07063.1 primosomal protein N' [Myxococcales bacterium]